MQQQHYANEKSYPKHALLENVKPKLTRNAMAIITHRKIALQPNLKRKLPRERQKKARQQAQRRDECSEK